MRLRRLRPRVTRSAVGAARSTWDANAARYAGQERLERRAVGLALGLAAPRPGERLVDLATGTGLLLRTLAEDDQRPAAAIGVDRSAAMLARVGDLPSGWGTVQADARRVPLPDGAADVVAATYVLHLLCAEDRLAVLGEACRLLDGSPAPRLVVVTVWLDPARAAGRVGHAALRSAARLSPAVWGGLHPLDPTADLCRAGLQPTHRHVLSRGGYPSLVIRAVPSRRTPDQETDRCR